MNVSIVMLITEKGKIALNYKDEKRKESYTYSDLKSYQIKQLMFLKIKDVKKEIVFLSLCLVHLNCTLRS